MGKPLGRNCRSFVLLVAEALKTSSFYRPFYFEMPSRLVWSDRSSSNLFHFPVGFWKKEKYTKLKRISSGSEAFLLWSFGWAHSLKRLFCRQCFKPRSIISLSSVIIWVWVGLQTNCCLVNGFIPRSISSLCSVIVWVRVVLKTNCCLVNSLNPGVISWVRVSLKWNCCLVNGLNPGVLVICLVWSSGWE